MVFTVLMRGDRHVWALFTTNCTGQLFLFTAHDWRQELETHAAMRCQKIARFVGLSLVSYSMFAFWSRKLRRGFHKEKWTRVSKWQDVLLTADRQNSSASTRKPPGNNPKAALTQTLCSRIGVPTRVGNSILHFATTSSAIMRPERFELPIF